MSKAKQLTTKYTEFNPENLTFTTLEENDRSMGQKIAFPRYTTSDGKEVNLLLQTPKIKITTGGVPRLGDTFKTDADRRFITVPLDLSNPEHKQFYEKLVAIDKHYDSDKVRKELHDKKASKYHYYPLVRHPEPDDDGVERPPQMKLKVDTTYPEFDVKTEVWRDKEGSKEKELLDVKSMDDLANSVQYQSTNTFIIKLFKMWAHKKPAGSTLGYGISIKVIKILNEPPEGSGNSLSSYYNQDAFIDSDDEESDNEQQATVESENGSDEKSESDSDSDSDSESDSEDNNSDEVVTKKTKGKKATK